MEKQDTLNWAGIPNMASVFGTKRTCRLRCAMSALKNRADIEKSLR